MDIFANFLKSHVLGSYSVLLLLSSQSLTVPIWRPCEFERWRQDLRSLIQEL